MAGGLDTPSVSWMPDAAAVAYEHHHHAVPYLTEREDCLFALDAVVAAGAANARLVRIATRIVDPRLTASSPFPIASERDADRVKTRRGGRKFGPFVLLVVSRIFAQ